MDASEVAAIEQFVRSQIGTNATYEVYDRTPKNPMNFVLDEAERQLSKNFIVYWVENSLPEIFYLSGFSVTPVVWSSRYIEIVSAVRKLIIDDSLSTLRVELSERVCLKVIAELCLRQGKPDLAVLAFLKQAVGKGIYIPESNMLQDLELSPINESYMVTWFLGLVHELGHSTPDAGNGSKTDNGLLSDKGIHGALEIALEQLPLPPELKREAMQKAKQHESGHPLSIENLRSEAAADIFATAVLFRSTLDIVQEVRPQEFQMGDFVQQFIAEMAINFNIIIVIERCSAMASIGSISETDRDAAVTIALHPASFFVRAMLIRKYLAFAGASIASDSFPPSEERVNRWDEVVHVISNSFEKPLEEVESGLAHAMRFVLFPHERSPNLMASFADDLSRSGGGMLWLETKRFCELADSLNITSEALQVLRNVADVS